VSILDGLRERGRIIDYLRREYPNETWAYDARAFMKWSCRSYEATMFSHIADAEREMFQSHLHVYRRGERSPLRQIPWGRAYFA